MKIMLRNKISDEYRATRSQAFTGVIIFLLALLFVILVINRKSWTLQDAKVIFTIVLAVIFCFCFLWLCFTGHDDESIEPRSKPFQCPLCKSVVNPDQVSHHREECGNKFNSVLQALRPAASASVTCPTCPRSLVVWPQAFSGPSFRCGNSFCSNFGKIVINNNSNCFYCFYCNIFRCSDCDKRGRSLVENATPLPEVVITVQDVDEVNDDDLPPSYASVMRHMS